MKKIKDVVNQDLVTVEKGTTFDKIVLLMKEKGIGKIPVLDNNKLIGVVTREDILVKQEKAPLPPVIAFWEVLIALPNTKDFQQRLRKFASFKVEDLMSDYYLVASMEDDLEAMVTKMIEENYNYILVIENSDLKGIVTKSDLIKKLY
ncbi:MAG: CBS domain-containing protein [Cetobacterium sp.]|uniref:CBS domain-containing protein n=1 Tax=unclassified Cetobacterium TaxID=2630983 RepID=UPI00163C00D1|nr:CBS domain-containing protein [Cetobacterium sp. 2A]MBC2856607.1 CBS domain-containing protein [Cetobacterium sp. 2A]